METNFRIFDHYPNALETFPALDTTFGLFRPITKPASLFVIGEGGSTFGRGESGIPLYFLGGPLRLSAYGLNELFGDQYYLLHAGYLHDILTLPPFIGKKVYAIGMYEFGKMYGIPTETKFPNDVAAGVLAETAVGPLFVGGSLGDSGHRKLFFQRDGCSRGIGVTTDLRTQRGDSVCRRPDRTGDATLCFSSLPQLLKEGGYLF